MKYEEIYYSLKEIGFKEIEAKIYVLLIKTPLISGYLIAKNTGYTKTQINQTLAKMIEKKYLRSHREKKLLYEAVELENIIEEQQRNDNYTLSNITSDFDTNGFVDTGIDIMHEEGSYDILLEQMIHHINSAIFRITVQVNEKIYLDIEYHLKKASDRGVIIFLVLPKSCEGMYNNNYINEICYKDNSTEDQSANYDLLIIFDKEVCIYGGIIEGEQKFIFTSNVPFIKVLSEFTGSIFTYRDFSELFSLFPIPGVNKY